MTQLNSEAIVASFDQLIAERDNWRSLAINLNDFHETHCDKLDRCSYRYRYRQLIHNNSQTDDFDSQKGAAWDRLWNLTYDDWRGIVEQFQEDHFMVELRRVMSVLLVEAVAEKWES